MAAFLSTILTLGAAAAAAEGGHGEATVFAGTIAQSVAAIVVFLLLVAVLYKLAWGPILTGLAEREHRIKADLERAEAAAREAEATLRSYQAQLASAREEAGKILDQGRIEAERASHRIQQEAQTELEAMKRRATAEIQFAKEQALRDIYEQAATLGTEIAGRILRREIRPADQQRLVQESLAALSAEDLR